MMRPANMRKTKRILAWAAIATSFAVVLSVGNTYSRVIDWASAELIYTPETVLGYRSDCLTVTGQDIMLSDWEPEDSSRTVEILVERPEPTQPGSSEEIPPEEELNPTESSQTMPTTTEASEPEEPEPDEDIDENPDPAEAATESAAAALEEAWTQDEVTVIPDSAAAQHLQCVAVAEEHRILLTLERLQDAPGLAQTTQMTILVQWKGLQGTFVLNMRPYGDLAVVTEEESFDPEQQIDTTQIPVKMWDTLAPENPVMCVKLNLETGSDFTVELFEGNTPLNKVCWSMDGEHYTMLYDVASLYFPYPYTEGWNGTVYLDFSYALASGRRPTVAVEATGFSRQECTPVYLPLPTPSQQMIKAADMPAILPMDTRWGTAVLTVHSIEQLTTDEEGNLIYTQDASIQASVVQAGIQMQPVNPDLLPQPGSYRVQIQWIWNDICVQQQTIYFFINTN